jgi:hypothetical protein
MSVLSRKRAAEAEAAEARGRMQQLVRLTVLARAAGPMAKTAGMAARDGARNAATWTAPRIERSGLAIRDTIAPKVCQTLAAAAQRVDVSAPRPDVTAARRRWPWVVAGTGLLMAAGAAAAVVLRRQKDDRASGVPGEPAEAVTGPLAAQNGQLDADGSGAQEDVTRQSPAT